MKKLSREGKINIFYLSGILFGIVSTIVFLYENPITIISFGISGCISIIAFAAVKIDLLKEEISSNAEINIWDLSELTEEDFKAFGYIKMEEKFKIPLLSQEPLNPIIIQDPYSIDLSQFEHQEIPKSSLINYIELSRENYQILFVDKNNYYFMIVEDGAYGYSVNLVGRASGAWDLHITMIEDLCCFGEVNFEFLEDIRKLLNILVRHIWPDWDEYYKDN
jgi:hypothetical protein